MRYKSRKAFDLYRDKPHGGISFPTSGTDSKAESSKESPPEKVTGDRINFTIQESFMRFVERGDAEKIKTYLSQGFPVNYQDPTNGETALHIAAACQARSVLRVLLNTGECDFLLRDKQGRLASELAYLVGRDPAVARLLGNKERKQAAEQGIKLTRRPQL